MLTAHEWTDFQRITRSIELFARYVMPRFSGHNAGLVDQWRRIEATTKDGTIPYSTGGRPSNLWR